jgi:PAS domain S-box-containing protein
VFLMRNKWKQGSKSSGDWLVGGGEMGELIRATDWSGTPLGPRQRWQPGLQATVRMVVENQFPMALLWGPELILIYNDAYRRVAADKHPRALGRSTREVWPEVWHINEPIFAAVLERGESVLLEDKLFPIDRNGRREDAHFTLCYSPIRSDDGAVAGSLVTLLETTRRAREEEASPAERNEVAIAVARERELLAGVVEHVPAMITIYDPRLATFHLNAEVRRVLGWTDEDANTGDVLALCYPEPGYREEVRRFMESAEPGWREFVATAKDGTQVTSSWANVRLSDSTQIGIGLDLRERKRVENALRDSEQQLLALYERNPAMVVLSEIENERIVRINDGFTQVFGFSADEAVGRTYAELGILPGPEDLQRIAEEVCAKGFVRNREVTVHAKSGAKVVGLLSSTVIESHGKKRLITVVVDITDRKRAEEALRASEERYRLIVETAGEGVIVADPDGSFVHVNGRMAEMLGYSVEEMLGKSGLDFVFDDAGRRQILKTRATLNRQSLLQEELKLRRKDGSPLWTLYSASPMLNEQGERIGILGMHIDISARKRGEKERERLLEEVRRAQERSSADLAAMTRLQELGTLFAHQTNLEPVLQKIVDAAIAISGADFGTIQLLDPSSSGLKIVAQRGFSDEWLELWNKVHAGQGVCGTALERRERMIVEDVEQSSLFAGTPALERQRQAGVRAVQSTPLVSRSGKPVGIFSTHYRKPTRPDDRSLRMLDLLARQAADIIERTQDEEALRVANDRLVDVDRRKNEFLAVLSHELRNPLAPIRNSLYILEHAAPGGEQARRALQVIERQAQQMTRLIDDLLDVTRISRGKISLGRERVDLNAVARATAEDHREIFTRNGIDLEVDIALEPLWVDGDGTRLAQVIGNLLSNSAKFTPRGGRTILRLDATPDGKAVLRVRDNGAGIAKETLQHLFEAFVQAPQTLDRTRGGLGLGLALVKGLIEMHGGEVAASSEGVDKGAEFTVTLPLQAPASPRLSTLPAAEPTTPARRVLVVEDNADAALSLREALELGQHEVVVAYSGPDGVEAARRYKPDVVLCDIGLPGMDGYDVARTLRGDPDTTVRTTFLIALSGYALQEDVTKSKQAGFDQHMAKPPSIEVLEKLLTSVRSSVRA